MDELFLIRKAQKGDAEALEKLIIKYYDNIFSFLARRCEDYKIAEDLTQDVFLRLVDGIGKYRFIGKFSNFIFTIAINVSTDYFRKKKVQLQDDFDLNELQDSTNMLSQIENSDRTSKLKTAMESLPPMQRETLILRFVHDLKIKDIARITVSSVPAVKSRLHQGLSKLKKILPKDDFFEKSI